MKNIKKPNLTILIFSVLVGIFMAGQFKQKIPSFAPVTLRNIQIIKSDINTVNKEIEDLNKMIAEKEEQIKVLENIANGDEDIIDILTDKLKKNQTVAGFREVEGSGIVIRMHDNMDEGAFGEEYNLDLIHNIDVFRVINDLRGAGAEAISINGQRVLSISEIKCGGPVIKVNGKSVATPFFIKAIGDPKLLSAAINAPNTYARTILKDLYQLDIEITIEDKIVIPAYNGRFNFKYSKPLKEGE